MGVGDGLGVVEGFNGLGLAEAVAEGVIGVGELMGLGVDLGESALWVVSVVYLGLTILMPEGGGKLSCIIIGVDDAISVCLSAGEEVSSGVIGVLLLCLIWLDALGALPEGVVLEGEALPCGVGIPSKVSYLIVIVFGDAVFSIDFFNESPEGVVVTADDALKGGA